MMAIAKRIADKFFFIEKGKNGYLKLQITNPFNAKSPPEDELFLMLNLLII
jgi:hypothetical protein